MPTECSVHRAFANCERSSGTHALPGLLRSQALLRVETRRPGGAAGLCFSGSSPNKFAAQNDGKFLSVALPKSDLWPGEPGPLHGFAQCALRA
jgi:hypothetical protein